MDDIFSQNNYQNSFITLADNLVLQTKQLIKEVETEEDLKIGFEKILEPILKQLNIKYNPQYERSIFDAGRFDALHGRVVIEYEKPKAFRSKQAVDHAYHQLVNYLHSLSRSEKQSLFISESKFVGVGFDGERIFFVEYRGDKNRLKTELGVNDFVSIDPFEFDQNSARTFLTHLRALSRLPLSAENLAKKFGPESGIGKEAVRAFADALEYWGNQNRIRTFFNEWKRLFGIVYGEQFNASQGKEKDNLSKFYQVGSETDFHELLFSLHTYFAFLMKLIAVEILTLRESSFSSSFSLNLAHFSDDELKNQLENIENGGIYIKKGITNFLEGDFFRWYTDALDYPGLKEIIREIGRTLSQFEPATSNLNPFFTRDLLKKLYQYLVPKVVRHHLGEYYTPDWLAELILNEVGYDGNNFKRVLDPACGSGTFLVLAIQRAIKWGKKNSRPNLEIAKSIVENIWGFDLNPLAVIASRTNYLFALGDLINELKAGFEIPIYLADSVLIPEVGRDKLFDEHQIEIRTSVKKFSLPAVWLKDGGMGMIKAAPILERNVKNLIEPEFVLKELYKEGLVYKSCEKEVIGFYKELYELEKEGKNGIWARFLKNSAAPLIAKKEKFDFVVGNPPWIRWDYLSQDYRNATLYLWKDYGLFSLKGFQTRLGGGKKDFSMLFVYASSDYYLKDGAKLGFLITQEVFKSKGAGEGFRRFQLGDGKYLKVLEAHDLVSIQPFEGATNKTAAIILKKGEKTEYPVPYIVWTKKKGAGKIDAEKLLTEVRQFLKENRYIAKPIGSVVGPWQTQSAKDLKN
jgi:type I restriction-modification system DNA methylase subunit